MQVFAILRFDADAPELELQVTVKEIVSTLELAEAEVARLNALNGSKGCRYVWRATRLFPPGAAAGSTEWDASADAS
jgi:hypothetical protein